MNGNCIVCFLITLSFLLPSCQTTPSSNADLLYDELYNRYRAGTIQRHIGNNGRYLQYTWLRSEDGVDLGLDSVQYPVIDLAPNARKTQQQFFGISPGEVKQDMTWYPVAFYEFLEKSIPDDYQLIGTLGYLALQASDEVIPLYEWRHNRIKEFGSNEFQDHFYSTLSNDPISTYRYLQNGIIGYLYKEAFPGAVGLYRGYHTTERNHVLTTDKSQGRNLANFQQLGYVRNAPLQNRQSLALKEWRKEANVPRMRDNMYIGETIPDNTGVAAIPEAFLARWVVGGGGDNPLYQGGLALAAFSLEHQHGMGNHSLQVAKKLFDFIEFSEEKGPDVLENGLGTPTGFLRRGRHPWWPNQFGDGTKWGASADELTGVLFGLKFFMDATGASNDPETMQYHARARSLLNRMADYLKEHRWIYPDTRVAAQGGVEDWLSEKMVSDYQVGMFASQFAFGALFRDYLGSRHIDDGNWLPTQVGSFNIPVIEGALLLPLLACAGDNPLLDFILQDHSCLTTFDLPCLESVSTPYSRYKLIVSNYAEIHYFLQNCDDLALVGQFVESWGDFAYYNHALLLYSLIIAFESSDASVSKNRKKELAKLTILYVRDMLNCAYGITWFGHCRGPAEDNLLFVLAAKYAFQQISYEEAGEWFVRPEHRRYGPAKAKAFEERVLDKIIFEKIGPGTNQSVFVEERWQEHLPLGYPRSPEYVDEETIQDECLTRELHTYPWERGKVVQPIGIGRNQTWEYERDKFEFWNDFQGKSPPDAFKQAGLFYARRGLFDPTEEQTNNWCPDATADNLKRMARIGDENLAVKFGPRMMIEAGGIDYLLMRMLAVQLGILDPPVLHDDQTSVNFLPVDGLSPW